MRCCRIIRFMESRRWRRILDAWRLEMVRAAAADRSTALTAEQIDQAAARFLAMHPQVDPDGVPATHLRICDIRLCHYSPESRVREIAKKFPHTQS
jgi:hypothetical protein